MGGLLLLLVIMTTSTVTAFRCSRYMNHFNTLKLVTSAGSRLGKFSISMGALDLPPLELCDENAEIVMNEVKEELGTIFGYDEGSRKVGITGEIELVEIDGPTIHVALKGRFWHATDTVMMRVESFIKNRIPEVLEVLLDMEKSTIVDDNRLNTEGSTERKLY